MIFGYFTLFVALIISAVAAYYSIVGLTTIFAAAVVPIIIMGAALEVGKITAAVWLKLNWTRAKLTYKLYLIPAVGLLMLLTSMGIFGFLSKAHSDQSLISGDVQAKIAIYDEKIKTARENIDANRKILKQMDEALDAVLSRSTTETGADKAVTIRRSQQKERARLASEIAAEQKTISGLSEERAPIAAEVRKVEAEVGPIKYIAALIYGNTHDSNLLEDAVRWVTIIIVAVFDPLALVLILAAQQSIRWSQEDKNKPPQEEQGSLSAENNNTAPNEQTLPPAPPAEQVGIIAQEVAAVLPEAVIVTEPSILEQHPYLNQKFEHFKDLKPMVYVPEKPIQANQDPAPVGWMFTKVDPLKKRKTRVKKLEQVETAVSPNIPEPNTSIERLGDYLDEFNVRAPYYKDLGNEYFDIDGKMVHSRVIRDLYPEVYADIERKKIQDQLLPQADNVEPSDARFGTQFPDTPKKGDLFLNINSIPSKLFKFNGNKWIEVDKHITDSYTYDEAYLKYLIDNINKGIMSADDLTLGEQDQIEQYIKKNG
jgi:hypothetical protein